MAKCLVPYVAPDAHPVPDGHMLVGGDSLGDWSRRPEHRQNVKT